VRQRRLIVKRSQTEPIRFHGSPPPIFIVIGAVVRHGGAYWTALKNLYSQNRTKTFRLSLGSRVNFCWKKFSPPRETFGARNRHIPAGSPANVSLPTSYWFVSIDCFVWCLQILTLMKHCMHYTADNTYIHQLYWNWRFLDTNKVCKLTDTHDIDFIEYFSNAHFYI
jgi:hypothetical protein